MGKIRVAGEDIKCSRLVDRVASRAVDSGKNTRMLKPVLIGHGAAIKGVMRSGEEAGRVVWIDPGKGPGHGRSGSFDKAGSGVSIVLKDEAALNGVGDKELKVERDAMILTQFEGIQAKLLAPGLDLIQRLLGKVVDRPVNLDMDGKNVHVRSEMRKATRARLGHAIAIGARINLTWVEPLDLDLGAIVVLRRILGRGGDASRGLVRTLAKAVLKGTRKSNDGMRVGIEEDEGRIGLGKAGPNRGIFATVVATDTVQEAGMSWMVSEEGSPGRLLNTKEVRVGHDSLQAKDRAVW